MSRPSSTEVSLLVRAFLRFRGDEQHEFEQDYSKAKGLSDAIDAPLCLREGDKVHATNVG